MVGISEITARETHGYEIGDHSVNGEVVARGECPYCGTAASFIQLRSSGSTGDNGPMVGLECKGCYSISAFDKESDQLYPAPDIEGISDLPDEIDHYYQEALRCIGARAPNGAATLFRKLIHAISVHYDIVEVEDYMGIPDMIKKLEEEDVILPRYKEALTETKELGNDGAHINENEPDMEQIKIIRRLIEGVLQSTVQMDDDIERAGVLSSQETSEDEQ